MPLTQLLVGPQIAGDGSTPTQRGGRNAEGLVGELHGRFYEQNFRGNIFSDGMTLTSISNATFTSATTGATGTPVAGLWNPSTSVVNCVILQVSVGVTMTALQSTGPGGFVWMTSVGNTAISTGNNPFNRKTLVASGSSAKGMCGVALTGLTNATAVRFGSALGGGSPGYAFLATAVAMQTQAPGQVENFDGSLIVPPGGVVALMATTTPVAHSAVSAIMWEEVPI
jgi:hypothetical protein